MGCEWGLNGMRDIECEGGMSWERLKGGVGERVSEDACEVGKEVSEVRERRHWGEGGCEGESDVGSEQVTYGGGGAEEVGKKISEVDYLESFDFDEFFDSVDDEELAIFVEIAYVASVKPAIFDRFCCRLIVFMVALHDLKSFTLDAQNSVVTNDG